MLSDRNQLMPHCPRYSASCHHDGCFTEEAVAGSDVPVSGVVGQTAPQGSDGSLHPVVSGPGSSLLSKFNCCLMKF